MQALGVVVLFYDIDNAQWRASAPVAANGVSKLTLKVEKLSVSLKPADK
jgi:type VI secretion system VasD/TssJ family lipoprotein